MRAAPAIAAILAALSASAGCGAQHPLRPNVLMIVISGVRADHVSAYGYRRPTTPNMDALAASGTLFENAIATAPWGLTSQASILTGLYPSEHAAAFEHPVVEVSLETLPEKLKAAGYATFAVSTDASVGRASGFAQGVDSFSEIHPEEEGSPDDGAAAAEAALLGWIKGRSGAAADSPFFAYVVLTNPHLPFNPPGEYRDKFLERPIPLPRLDRMTQLWLPFARQFTMGIATLAPDELAALVSLYDGELAYADYRLGRIIGGLRGSGVLDDTLVVVTSDAGEDLGDHDLLADAATLYDTIVKVPLVMRLPDRVAAGKRVADQVQTVDIMKAVLALTAPRTEGITTAIPASSPLESRPAAICEARVDPGALHYYRSIMPGKDLSFLERNLLAVRTPDFKYILTSRGTAALFDLKADPGEKSSVLASRMEKAQDLQAKINSWAATLRPAPFAPGTPAAAATTPPAGPKPGQAR